jgi:hypothetical protein
MDIQTRNHHLTISDHDNILHEQQNLEQIWQQTHECWTGSVAEEFHNQVIAQTSAILTQLRDTLAQYSGQ